MFTTQRRRETTAGPGAGREPSSELVEALPPRFEAVGEALASGSGTVPACEVVGAALARDGISLGEALDALADTARLVTGGEPAHADTRALAVAWSEAMLGYLNDLSCEDPLTGLATLAHLRSRVSDAYRAELATGTPAVESHALVVVTAAPPGGDQPSEDTLARAMEDARLGECARTVFPGAETIGHLAPGRVAVLVERDDRLGRRVGLLRRLLEGGRVAHTRVWVEGLPGSDAAAGRLLDELTRR